MKGFYKRNQIKEFSIYWNSNFFFYVPVKIAYYQYNSDLIGLVFMLSTIAGVSL